MVYSSWILSLSLSLHSFSTTKNNNVRDDLLLQSCYAALIFVYFSDPYYKVTSNKSELQTKMGGSIII